MMESAASDLGALISITESLERAVIEMIEQRKTQLGRTEPPRRIDATSAAIFFERLPRPEPGDSIQTLERKRRLVVEAIRKEMPKEAVAQFLLECRDPVLQNLWRILRQLHDLYTELVARRETDGVQADL